MREATMRIPRWLLAYGLTLCVACGGSVEGARADGGWDGAAGDGSPAADGPRPDGPADAATTDAAGADGGAGSDGAPLTHVTFTPTDEDFLNPERGFYGLVDLASSDDYGDVRAAGFTVAYAGVHLEAFRTSPLSGSFLTTIVAPS